MNQPQHTRLAIVAAVLLAGCVTAPPLRGEVAAQQVDSAVAPEERMTLASNETFENPLPSAENELPSYPDIMLAHRLPPQAVCVRVSIDEKGKVSATAPIAAGPDCPAEANAAAQFYQAAEQATEAWHFDPAFRCVYPEGTKPQRHGCFGEDVEEIPQAVSLVYRFVFEQVDGRGAVHLAN